MCIHIFHYVPIPFAMKIPHTFSSKLYCQRCEGSKTLRIHVVEGSYPLQNLWLDSFRGLPVCFVLFLTSLLARVKELNSPETHMSCVDRLRNFSYLPNNLEGEILQPT